MQEISYSQRLIGKGKGIVVWQRLERFRRAAKQIGIYADNQSLDKILDLGASDGIAFPFLSPLAKRIISLNYYHIQCKEFKSNYPNEYIVNTDGRKLPFQDESMDIVVSLEALHLVPDLVSRIHCLNEIYRILKPNGLFVCSVPIEVGIPGLFKYLTRLLHPKLGLQEMTFGLMLKHCFYHFFDLNKLDKGRQVGFNAHQFANQVSERFAILKRINIPLPYPFCTNLMLVCKKKFFGNT